MFVDLRGITYDASTQTIFATQDGYSDHFFQLMKIDYLSGTIEDSVRHVYADDLYYTNSGDLLVGSTSQPVSLFDSSLNKLLTFGVGEQTFVTQAPTTGAVPEASTYGIAAGLLSLFIVCISKCQRKKMR